MKIHFLSSSLTGGGAERVMALLANHFVKEGHEVSIITFNSGDAFKLDSRIKRVRLHSGLIKNHTLRCLFNLILFYRKKYNRPEVAISFIRKMSFSAIIAAKLYSIKIIASEHNNHLIKFNRIGNFTWNHLYRYADYVTVLTSFDKKFFEQRGARVKIMPNPVTFVPINTLPSKRSNVILAIGSLNRYHHKGFDNLIVLIAPILKARPEWILKIVGGGSKGLQLLQDLAFHHGVSDQIIFTGFREDVNILMQDSKIFILPSRFEGLPMVLLEAMSQGTACIAFDCITGPSEIIQHNHNGLLIENQSHQDMQEGLLRLIDDCDLRETISVNGLKSLDRFAIERIYMLWKETLDELVR